MRLLVSPSSVRAPCSPKTAASWGHAWAAQMKLIPSARSLAIRVRSVGRGAVDGSSSSTAWNGGHNLPHGLVFAASSAVSRTCSAKAVISGDAEA